jgi:hypothetical protein
MSRKDAATLIQTNFRAYKCRQDYALVARKTVTRTTLFKATIRSEDDGVKMLTCALKSQRDRAISLLFYLTSKRSSAGSVEIDLTKYENIDTNDLKSRILRIIGQSLNSDDLSQAIYDAFNTDKAARILLESSSPSKNGTTKAARARITEKRIDTASEMELRRMHVEEEIERIRRMASSGQYVQLEKVTIQGSLTNKFEPQAESEEEEFNNGLEQLSEDGVEVDFT